jgi:hypothetical protein
MIRIGDFSKLSRVSVKTLRYYDEIDQLKPCFSKICIESPLVFELGFCYDICGWITVSKLGWDSYR